MNLDVAQGIQNTMQKSQLHQLHSEDSVYTGPANPLITYAVIKPEAELECLLDDHINYSEKCSVQAC